MHRRHRLSLVWPFLSMLILLVLTTAACGSTTTTGGSTSPAALTKVSIGLGYIPDIQFAPFYVAQSKGYYRDAGLGLRANSSEKSHRKQEPHVRRREVD